MRVTLQPDHEYTEEFGWWWAELDFEGESRSISEPKVGANGKSPAEAAMRLVENLGSLLLKDEPA